MHSSLEDPLGGMSHGSYTSQLGGGVGDHHWTAATWQLQMGTMAGGIMELDQTMGDCQQHWISI
ncbi:hypothetical protein Pyn_20583 [Prunus yedoensis var. nudiflora]|nr:hypothetical protein Pyn_20583 [Prunus yedoensis var. nudiflora]